MQHIHQVDWRTVNFFTLMSPPEIEITIMHDNKLVTKKFTIQNLKFRISARTNITNQHHYGKQLIYDVYF